MIEKEYYECLTDYEDDEGYFLMRKCGLDER